MINNLLFEQLKSDLCCYKQCLTDKLLTHTVVILSGIT